MDYKVVKYSEIGKIRSGKRLPKGHTVSEEISDNKYIRVRDINNGSIDSSIVQYISDEAAEKLERYRVKTRDVIISVVGTVGAIAQIEESLNGAYLTENCDNLQVDESICLKDYLKYYLLSEDGSKEIIANTVGSTQPKLPIYGIENFNIKLPSIDNQKRIVRLLNSIDDKIKINNQINNNLYELSQRIYKQWFVDFEYPIALGETYRSNGGNFIEVDGMMIPDEFKVCKLDEICDCQNGHAFYKEGYDDSGLMVIDLGNVSLQGNFIYTNADKYINKDRIPNEKFIVKKNDLVMIMTDRKATMDLLGKTAKIYENKEFALNQRIYRIRPTINVNYVYSFLNSNTTLDKLKGVALGSVQKYVNTNHINDLKIIVPSVEIMSEYSMVVDPIFKRMEENILENRNLEIIRDTLLPKLMNGEIDLDNIEI